MRTVSWFSCGAASAVATKLALADGPVVIANCEVAEEHPDNRRFLKDCEKWFGQEIIVMGNDKYHRSIYEVFLKNRYLVGVAGAKCTGTLKKEVRKKFELPDDRQVFGYTAEEEHRVNRFIDANNEVDIWPILIERGLTKADCLGMIENAGIDLPAMYRLGFHNANCVGCVKGGAGYWNKIREVFPKEFERMAQCEESLGRTVCKIDMQSVENNWPDIYKKLGEPEIKNGVGKVSWRPTLRELPPDAGDYPSEIQPECGIFCYLAEQDYKSESQG